MLSERQSGETEEALAIVRHAIAGIEGLYHALSPDAAGVSLRAVAERLYLERRRRDEHFPPGLFGEPAWDLLLALYLAREDGRELSLAEAYDAGQVDASAGAAVLDKLVATGLAVRKVRGPEGRLSSVTLTEHGAERLSAYFIHLL